MKSDVGFVDAFYIVDGGLLLELNVPHCEHGDAS